MGTPSAGRRQLPTRRASRSAPRPVAWHSLFRCRGPRLCQVLDPSSAFSPIRQRRWRRHCAVGDFFVVSRASYGYSRYSFDSFELPIEGRFPALMPRRGDLIVFRLTRDRKTSFLKRVVGLPGDRIQMVKGRLSINGQLVRIEAAQRIPDPSGGKGEVPTYVETLAEAPPIASFSATELLGRTIIRLCTRCRPATSSCSATTAAIPPTAGSSRRAMASASCRSSS